MTKVKELREMSDEQLGLTLKETTESLFRLRLQPQTERLDAPSERKHRPDRPGEDDPEPAGQGSRPEASISGRTAGRREKPS